MLNVHAPGARSNIGELQRAALIEGAPQNADPAGFASLLRQTQSKEPAPKPVNPPAPVPAPRSAANAEQAATDNTQAPPDAETSDGADDASRAKAIQKSNARAGESAAPAQHVPSRAHASGDADAKPVAAEPGAAAEKSGEDAKTGKAAAETPVDPTIMQWLAALQRSGAAPAAATAADGKAAGEAPAEDGGDAAGKDAKAKLAADAKGEVLQREASRADPSADAALATEARFAALLAEKNTPEAKAESASGTTALKDAGAAGAASFAPGPGTAREAAAPAAVALATPVNSPDFPQALGLQMSVLARDGVHEAELHLNPADMGPVSVQIVMDGTQARIDFGADMAATRHAIEAGLPELASALRDAGFTLAGGGVSDNARSRSDSGGGRDGGPSEGGRRPRAVDAEATRRVSAAARRIVTAGGVDLFV